MNRIKPSMDDLGTSMLLFFMKTTLMSFNVRTLANHEYVQNEASRISHVTITIYRIP